MEMPDRLVQNLIMFMRQNNDVLSKRRREGEFEKLTDEEISQIETAYRDAFQEYPPEGLRISDSRLFSAPIGPYMPGC